MSLDVYLVGRGTPALDSLRERIFIREDGRVKEITRGEWDERYPGREPTVVTDIGEGDAAFDSNITHNLGKMADEVDLYLPLWRPEEIGITLARQLVEPLREGLQRLLAEKERLLEFNPANGWGNYDVLVEFTAGYLAACERFPEAHVEVSR